MGFFFPEDFRCGDADWLCPRLKVGRHPDAGAAAGRDAGGLRDRQRDYIDWVLKASLKEGVAPDDVLTDEAATLLAAKLKTPLQIGQHLARIIHEGLTGMGQAADSL